MIEKLKQELRSIEEGIVYMELSDTAWSHEYTKLWKQKRVLKKAIKKLERIEKNEVHKNGKNSL
jgi:hypothetical protein